MCEYKIRSTGVQPPRTRPQKLEVWSDHCSIIFPHVNTDFFVSQAARAIQPVLLPIERLLTRWSHQGLKELLSGVEADFVVFLEGLGLVSPPLVTAVWTDDGSHSSLFSSEAGGVLQQFGKLTVGFSEKSFLEGLPNTSSVPFVVVEAVPDSGKYLRQ